MSGNGKRNKFSNNNCDPSGQPNSPALIECPEPNCSKKYRHINGLKYHQSHAHFGSTFNVSDTQEFSESQANNPTTSNTGETTPIKGGDVSDSDNNESDSPIKKPDSQQNDTIINDQSSELKKKNVDSIIFDDCNKSSQSTSLFQHKIVTDDSTNIDQSDVTSDSDLVVVVGNNCEMMADDKPVASPAFSDISDDNSNNNDSGSGGAVACSSDSKTAPK
ncbi:hypothetical protein BLA29_010415, partial [Euroglyphus maynei]